MWQKEKREKRKGELGKSGVLDKGRAESAQFAGSICESKRFFYPVLQHGTSDLMMFSFSFSFFLQYAESRRQ